jgi:hypothetical protein
MDFEGRLLAGRRAIQEGRKAAALIKSSLYA